MKKILLPLLMIHTTFFAMEPDTPPQKKSIISKAKDAVFKKSKQNADFRVAVLTGDVAEVERFLKLGIGPNTLCKKQFPLLLAASNGHKDVCQVLLDAGADVNAASKKSDAALLGAIDFRQSDVCKLLIARGANIHARCAAGKCPALLYAAAALMPDICQILIEKDADVNATNSHGATALLKVINTVQEGYHRKEANQPEDLIALGQIVCKILIDAGADVNAHHQGLDALHYAKCNLQDGIAYQLLSAGISVMHEMRLYDFFTKHQHFFSHIALGPDLKDIASCKEKIIFILWCLKQINPRAPKQINWMILAHIPTHHLGKILVGRKLYGLPIPLLLTNCAARTLYASTITHLPQKLFSTLRHYNPEKSKIIDKYEDIFEETFGQEIWKTICAGLAQPKLLCNN